MPEWHYRLAKLYKDKEQRRRAYSQAAASFTAQLNANPNDGYLMSRLGLALAGLEKEDDAEAFLREAVKKGADDWRIWAALTEFLNGQGGKATCNTGRVT